MFVGGIGCLVVILLGVCFKKVVRYLFLGRKIIPSSCLFKRLKGQLDVQGYGG